MPKLLHEYQNGNCFVQLFDDGTKIRKSGAIAAPIFPESIDLKITNWCDKGCSWCHEKSTIKGKHANINWFYPFIDRLHPGMELAIGGGDPLSHPQILKMVEYATEKKMVCNLTVNSAHIKRHAALIHKLREAGLKGLGISIEKPYFNDIELVTDDNTVLHVIAGITPLSFLPYFRNRKILVLGYKQFGFGQKYYNYHDGDIEFQLGNWRYWLPTIIKRTSNSYSFDNLAIEQLKVREFLDEEYFSKFYMGDDGQFTMYVDLVEMKFAKSSTSTTRYNIGGISIEEMFRIVRWYG